MRKRKKEFIYLRCSRYDYRLRILFILCWRQPLKSTEVSFFAAARQMSLPPRHKFELPSLYVERVVSLKCRLRRGLFFERDDEREQLLQRPGDDSASRDAASNTALTWQFGEKYYCLWCSLCSPRLTFDWQHCFRTTSMTTTRIPSFGGTLLPGERRCLGMAVRMLRRSRYVHVFRGSRLRHHRAQNLLTDSTFKSRHRATCLEEAPGDEANASITDREACTAQFRNGT